MSQSGMQFFEDVYCYPFKNFNSSRVYSISFFREVTNIGCFQKQEKFEGMMHVLTMQEEFRISFSSHVMEVSFFMFWVQLLAGSDLKRIFKKSHFLTIEFHTH